MKVCESCCAQGYHDRVYHGQRIKVICGACLGARSILLGPEGRTRWQQQREEALAQAIREGWYEECWDGGEPGQARKVVRLIGRADLVQRTA